MTTTPTNAPQLSDTSAQIDSLARLVWWDFSGCKITPADLRTRAAVAGIDPDTIGEIDEIAALNRAVREFTGRGGGGKKLEAVIAHDDDSSVVVNILELQRRSSRRMAKEPIDTLIWTKGTPAAPGSWQLAGTSEHAQKLIDRVALRQQYLDGNDVRSLIVQPALAAASAFTLRRGMYVVMNAASEPVAKAQQSLETLESFSLNVASVARGAGWDQPVQNSAEADVRNDLSELQEQIDGWRESARRVRQDTQATVLRRFAELRSRATLYSEALAVSLEDLQDEISDMEQLAEDVIEGANSDAEQREADRAAGDAAPSDPAEIAAKLRTTLAALDPAQLRRLWMSLCDGDMPDDPGDMVEQVAAAREALAA